MKTCTKCLQEKPKTDFNKKTKARDGLSFTCRACEKIKNRIYYENNKQVILDRAKKWVDENPSRRKETHQRWIEEHPQTTRKYKREWAAKNREYGRAANAKRRALRLEAETSLTSEEWQNILLASNYCCVYCGDQWEQQDHVVPISKGGSHTADNVVPACEPCNKSKHNKDLNEFLERRRQGTRHHFNDHTVRLAKEWFEHKNR